MRAFILIQPIFLVFLTFLKTYYYKFYQLSKIIFISKVGELFFFPFSSDKI